MFARLQALERRLEALDRMLMDPSITTNSNRLREVTKEHAQVSNIVDEYRRHNGLVAQLAEARDLLVDGDAEMREMAREEIAEIEGQTATSVERLRLLLLPKDPYEGRPLLLEIRAGTGGDEAALFAADLFRMYVRFGERNGLRIQVLSSSHITVGGSGKTNQGFKEVVASVNGKTAYSLLRFEAGVHRVQRIPATESQGRIHTSAATVAVLPEPETVELNIDPKELRIDTMRAGGPGGQSVNTTDSAVRITHLPTGLIVQCQDEKSQLKNKQKAMRVLNARLLAKKREAKHAEEAAARKAMVGTGDRSERIRTYNYPQNRCTDHRIGLTLYKLDQIVNGELQLLIDGLTADYQARLLAEQEVA
jgi:peptide chain release factor 1